MWLVSKFESQILKRVETARTLPLFNAKSVMWEFQSQLRWEYLSFNNEKVQMAYEV